MPGNPRYFIKAMLSEYRASQIFPDLNNQCNHKTTLAYHPNVSPFT